MRLSAGGYPYMRTALYGDQPYIVSPLLPALGASLDYIAFFMENHKRYAYLEWTRTPQRNQLVIRQR